MCVHFSKPAYFTICDCRELWEESAKREDGGVMCGVDRILCIFTSTEADVCAGEVVCKKKGVFSVGSGEIGQDTVCVSTAVLLK